LRFIVEQVDDGKPEADQPDEREAEKDGQQERQARAALLLQRNVRCCGHDTLPLRLFA
jgi:hypothetical protein